MKSSRLPLVTEQTKTKQQQNQAIEWTHILINNLGGNSWVWYGKFVTHK